MSLHRVAVVVGAGPGIGAAVAKRFAAGGYSVAIIARKMDTLSPIKEDIEKSGGKAFPITADASETKELQRAFATIRKEVGNPEVLVYNAGTFIRGGILELSPDELVNAMKLTVGGALTASQEVLPSMVEEKRGTIIFTGATASLRGASHFGGLSIPKFGLRSLSQSMSREFHPKGVHIAHAIIDGQVLTSPSLPEKWNRNVETFIQPSAVAETYWHLHHQDRSAWTQELDIRPHVEKF